MPNIKPFYAVKSNPSKELINILQQNKQIGFDIASIKEIDLTKNYLENNGIIFSNPCKNIDEILHAKKNNIDLLVIDDIDELKRLYKYYPNAKIIIRVKSTEKYSQITFNSKFGTDYNGMNELIQFISKNKINFQGISYHVGSKCNNMIAHKLTLENIQNVYNPLLKKYNLKTNIINIGGGFTTKYDLKNFNDINSGIIKQFINEGNTIIAEPGRYFSNNYYGLIATVKSVRKNGDIYNITINDSIYHTFNGIICDNQIYNPIFH